MPENDDFEKKREEELERFLEEAEPEIEFLDEKEISFASREYKTFREEERKHRKKSWYEKACNLARKIIEIEPSPKRKEDLQRAIEFAYLQITPEGAYSFAILSGASIILLSLILLATGLVGLVFSLILFTLGGGAIYFLAEFPKSEARLFRVKASNEIMLALIYIVIYMRSTPNLEGAIRFAARHLKGPLSLDFKKLLWDIETRNYSSMRAALADYLEKWKKSEGFVEAMEIVQNSMEQSDEKRKSMLDEAVNTLMSDSRQRMQHYSNSLRLPIMIIHALGIMLPIMVLVMFPIITLMLQQTIKPIFLVIGYDILLPLIIYTVGKRTLEYRPLGFSNPDVSMHPKYSGLGKIDVMGRKIKIWPIAASVSAAVIVIGIFLTGLWRGGMFQQMSTSLVLTWGVGLGPAIYFLLDSQGKVEIRQKIRRLEEGFSEALFSLGNRLSLGKPIEGAMQTTVKKNKDLEISDLFRRALRNIRKGGMNLKNSLFDKEYGAIWNYPSKLIHSVLRVVVQAAEKDIKVASMSAISISKYLKQMRRVEGDLKEMLSGETTSMQFLGAFLGPLIAGVSVAMGAIMMVIFQRLGGSLESLRGAAGGLGDMGLQGLMVGGWGSVENIIPISWFQLIVGVYVVETSYLLSMLSSGIENGPGDKIARRQTAGITILIGLMVYSLSTVVVWKIFGSQITSLLMGGFV